MVVERNCARDTGQTYEELLASLIESARLISGKLSLDEVEDIIVAEARRLFDAKAGWLFFYDSKDDLLKIERFWGPNEEAFRGFSVRPGEGISGVVFLTQQPEVTLKADKYLTLIPNTTTLPDDAPALAVFPLSVGGRRIGVIGITSETVSKKGLTEDEFNSVVSAFANHIAIALDTALLFEEKKRVELELKNSVQRLQMINEIGIDVIKDLDLSVIIRKVARYTTDIFNTDAAVINLGNKDGTVIEAAYFYNMSPETEEIFLTKQTIARRVFEYPRRVLINDYPEHAWALTEFIELGVKSLIMVPVISKGRVLATLSAVSFREERVFIEDDFDELEFVARHVAVAIENTRLYYEQVETRKKMEDYASQLRMLNDFSQRITREGNSQDMAEQLAKSARTLFNCAVSVVLLCKNSMDEIPTLSWSTDGSQSCNIEPFEVDLSTHSGLYSEMFRTKKTLRLNDISDHPHFKGLPEHHMHMRGLLGAPLLDSNDEFIGQVMVSNKKDGSDFTESDEELLVALCAQVAIGIERVEAYEREHSIAETLQQAILTAPVNLPGVEIGTIYESAAEAAKVGGDFYDLFELGDGTIGILIGDVSGKGLEAATITLMVKSTIRAFAYRGLSPADILTEANKVICRQLGFNQFVTMLYGALDPGTGRMIISRAGHPEIIIWVKNKCVFCCDESNLPVGVMEDIIYEQSEIILSQGDGVILYTDGLTEARCKNELLGEDVLIDELNKIIHGKDSQEVACGLVNIAKDFVSGKPQDDIAVVVLKLKPREGC